MTKYITEFNGVQFMDKTGREKIKQLDTGVKDIAKKTITDDERTKLTTLKNYDDASVKANIQSVQQQVNNLVLGAVGDGNNAEVVQSRDNEKILNDRISKIEKGYRISNLSYNAMSKTNVNIIDYSIALYDKNISGYDTTTKQPIYGTLANNLVVSIKLGLYCGTIKIPKNNVSGQLLLVLSKGKVIRNYTYKTFVAISGIWVTEFEDCFEINCAKMYSDFMKNLKTEVDEILVSMSATDSFAYRKNGIRIDDNESIIDSYAKNSYPFSFNASLIQNNINCKSLSIAIKDIRINTNNINDIYYISDINLTSDCFKIKISSVNNSVVLISDNIPIKNEIQKIYFDEYNNSRCSGYILINTSEIDTDLQNFGWIKMPSSISSLSQRTIYVVPKIVIPPKIYGVSNKEIAVYLKNITNCNLNDYIIRKKSGTGDFVSRKRIIYNITKGWADSTLFDIYSKTNEKISSYEIPFKIVDTNANNGVTKKCMFIGDSFIASHKITNELGDNLFKNDVMKLKLLGTQGWTHKHEGRAGWSSYDYVATESFNNSTNAFLNNGTFDFNYYMTQNSMETPDWVFIQVGINDTWRDMHNTTTVQNLNTMISSIKSFNSNIKIGIALVCPPYMGEFYLDDDKYSQNLRLKINEDIITSFKDKENENIYIVPINVNLDCEYNFTMTTEVVNSRNDKTITKCADTTHPDVSGYSQIADSYYSFLKCN